MWHRLRFVVAVSPRGASDRIDPTPSQLRIARDLESDFATDFPLLRAAAERLPFAEDSFDLAISEYGAATWADPYLWIPEAARVLRPGGELVFLCNSTLLMLCVPEQEELAAEDRMLRPQFGMHRLEWSDPVCTEIQPQSRGLDPPAPEERLRGTRSVGAPAAARCCHPILVRHEGVGAQMAVRGGVWKARLGR